MKPDGCLQRPITPAAGSRRVRPLGRRKVFIPQALFRRRGPDIGREHFRPQHDMGLLRGRGSDGLGQLFEFDWLAVLPAWLFVVLLDVLPARARCHP